MSKKLKRLRNLVLNSVDLVPTGANPGANIKLFKNEKDVPSATGLKVDDECHKENPEKDSADLPEVTMADDETAAESTEEATEEGTAEVTEEATEENTEEAESKEEAAELEKSQAETVSLRKGLDTANEKIAKMEAVQRTRDFVAKAKEFTNLGSVEIIGKLLNVADEHFSADEYDYLEKILKGASAQVEEGALFAQLGKTDGEADEWEDRLKAAAKDRVAKGDAETFEIAKRDIMNEDPDMQKEYEKSVR